MNSDELDLLYIISTCAHNLTISQYRSEYREMIIMSVGLFCSSDDLFESEEQSCLL